MGVREAVLGGPALHPDRPLVEALHLVTWKPGPPRPCLWCMESTGMRGIKMGEEAEFRQERQTRQGHSIWTTTPQPQGQGSHRCLLESLLPQSVVPTREEGEVLGDSTGGEDSRSLLLTDTPKLLLPQVHHLSNCFC